MSGKNDHVLADDLQPALIVSASIASFRHSVITVSDGNASAFSVLNEHDHTTSPVSGSNKLPMFAIEPTGLIDPGKVAGSLREHR